MSLFTRAISSGLRAGLGVVVALAIAIGSLVLYSQTDTFKSWLRATIVREANQRLAGTVALGKIEGNLFSRLDLHDVVVRDSLGALVAAVDTLQLRLSPLDLLHSQLTISRLDLAGPRIELRRYTDGVWNVGRVTHLTAADTTVIDTTAAAGTWGVTVGQLVIRRGRFAVTDSVALLGLASRRDTTIGQTAVERAIDAVNYDDLDVRNLELTAALDLTPTTYRAHIAQLSLTAPNAGLVLRRLTTDVTLDTTQFQLDSLALETRDSRLAGRLRFGIDVRRDFSLDRLYQAPIDLSLAARPLEIRDLQRFAPNTEMLGGKLQSATLVANGRLDSLVIQRADLATERSDLHLSGRIVGLPSATPEMVWTTTAPSTLHPGDLLTSLPGLDLPDYAYLGPVDVRSARFNGTPYQFALELDAGTARVGRIGLDVDLDVPDSAATVRGVPLGYNGVIDLHAVNLAALLADPTLRSRLTGRLRLDGSGYDPGRTNVKFAGNLTGSMLMGRRLDRLTTNGTLRGQHLALDGKLASGPSQLDLTLTADLGNAWGGRGIPSYTIHTDARTLDLAPLLLNDSLRTSLTFTLDGAGRGFTLEDLRGRFELALDTGSTVNRRAIPGATAIVEIADSTDTIRRLSVRSGLLDADVIGDFDLDRLTTLGTVFGAALGRTLAENLIVFDSSAVASRQRAAAVAAEVVTNRSNRPNAASRAAQGSARGSRPTPVPRLRRDVDLEYRAELKNVRLLAAPLRLRPFDAGASLSGSLRGNTDDLSLSGRLLSDTLWYDTTFASRNLTADFTFDHMAPASLMEATDGSFTLTAAAIRFGTFVVTKPILQTTYRERELSLFVDAAADSLDARANLNGSLRITPDQYDLSLLSLSLAVAGEQWRNTGPIEAIYRRDEAQIGRLELENAGQRIAATGGLRANGEQTLRLTVENLSVATIQAFVRPTDPVPLVGRLNLTLALGGQMADPLDSLSFSLDSVRYDRFAFQRFTGGAVYHNQRLIVKAALDDSLKTGAGKPQNQLSAYGSIPIDLRYSVPVGVDRVKLDSAVSINVRGPRIDLSIVPLFFPYVRDVVGSLKIELDVSGTLRRPLVDGNIPISPTAFTFLPTGVRHTDLRGLLLVTADSVRIVDLTVRGGDGRARLNGGIVLEKLLPTRLDLTAQLTDFLGFDRADEGGIDIAGRAIATGQIVYQGPLNAPRLTGALTLAGSELIIPIASSAAAEAYGNDGFITIISRDSLRSITVDSTGALIRQRLARLVARPVERTYLDALTMQLKLNIPTEARIRFILNRKLGEELVANVTGNLLLGTEDGELTMRGGLTTTSRGYYNWYLGFTRFDITRGGEITFDGPIVDPVLRLSAEQSVQVKEAETGRYETYQVVVQITGRGSEPFLDFDVLAPGGVSLKTVQGSQTGVNLTEAVVNLIVFHVPPSRSTLAATTDGGLSNILSGGIRGGLSSILSSTLGAVIGLNGLDVAVNRDESGRNAYGVNLVQTVNVGLKNPLTIISGGTYSTDASLSGASLARGSGFGLKLRLQLPLSDQWLLEGFYLEKEADGILATEINVYGTSVAYRNSFDRFSELFDGSRGRR